MGTVGFVTLLAICWMLSRFFEGDDRITVTEPSYSGWCPGCGQPISANARVCPSCRESSNGEVIYFNLDDLSSEDRDEVFQAIRCYEAADLSNAIERFRGLLARDVASEQMRRYLMSALQDRINQNVESGNLDDAIEDCTAMVECEPTSGAGYFIRAQLHARAGNLSLAEEDATESIDKDDAGEASIMLRAHIRLHAGKYAEALEDVNMALDQPCDRAHVLTVRGRVCLAMGDSEQAAQNYQLVRTIDANRTDLLVSWSEAFYQAGNFHLARESINAAIELEPESAEHYCRRGIMYMLAEDSALAEADFSAALDLDAACHSARGNRGILRLKQNRYDDAIADFDTLIKQVPDDAAAYRFRSEALRLSGKLKLAGNDIDKAMELDPQFAISHSIERLHAEAEFHYQSDDFGQAVSRLNVALMLDPKAPQTYLRRAVANWYQGFYAEAKEDLDEFLKLAHDPISEMHGRSCRGQVLADMGETAEAMDDLDRAIALAQQLEEPEVEAYSLSGRGLAYAMDGRFPEADEDFDRSIGLCPGNAWVYFNRAVKFERQQRIGKAIENYQAALVLSGPPIPPSKRNRAMQYLGNATLRN